MKGGTKAEDGGEFGSFSPQVHSSPCNHRGGKSNGPRVAIKEARAQVMSHRKKRPLPHFG